MEQEKRSAWTAYLMFCTIVASFSSFLFGYNSSVIDAPGKVFKNCQLTEMSYFPACIQASTTEWGLVVSMMCIGALVGCLVAGFMTDYFGRKKTILYNGLPYMIGLALLTFASNLLMLAVGRFFTGVGVGVTTVAVPLYLTEIASDEIRGSIGSFHQFSCVIGVLIGQVLGIPFAELNNWRFLFAIPLVAVFVQSILLIWICESPKYLLCQNNVEAAQSTYTKLRGYITELPNLEESKKKTEYLSIRKLFFQTPAARKSLLTGIVMHLGQPFSGINAVFYFSTTFFEGFSVKPAVIAVCLGILNLLVTILAVWLIEKVGRRSLLLFSTVSMFLCGIILTVFMVIDFAVGRVVLVLLFVASFSIGIGPVTWLILNEIYPKEAVIGAVSVAVSINWISNFVVGLTFETVAKALGNYAFVPFCVVLALFFSYTWAVVPETKGRPVSYL